MVYIGERQRQEQIYYAAKELPTDSTPQQVQDVAAKYEKYGVTSEDIVRRRGEIDKPPEHYISSPSESRVNVRSISQRYTTPEGESRVRWRGVFINEAGPKPVGIPGQYQGPLYPPGTVLYSEKAYEQYKKQEPEILAIRKKEYMEATGLKYGKVYSPREAAKMWYSQGVQPLYGGASIISMDTQFNRLDKIREGYINPIQDAVFGTIYGQSTSRTSNIKLTPFEKVLNQKDINTFVSGFKDSISEFKSNPVRETVMVGAWTLLGTASAPAALTFGTGLIGYNVIKGKIGGTSIISSLEYQAGSMAPYMGVSYLGGKISGRPVSITSDEGKIYSYKPKLKIFGTQSQIEFIRRGTLIAKMKYYRSREGITDYFKENLFISIKSVGKKSKVSSSFSIRTIKPDTTKYNYKVITNEFTGQQSIVTFGMESKSRPMGLFIKSVGEKEKPMFSISKVSTSPWSWEGRKLKYVSFGEQKPTGLFIKSIGQKEKPIFTIKKESAWRWGFSKSSEGIRQKVLKYNYPSKKIAEGINIISYGDKSKPMFSIKKIAGKPITERPALWINVPTKSLMGGSIVKIPLGKYIKSQFYEGKHIFKSELIKPIIDKASFIKSKLKMEAMDKYLLFRQQFQMNKVSVAKQEFKIGNIDFYSINKIKIQKPTTKIYNKKTYDINDFYKKQIQSRGSIVRKGIRKTKTDIPEWGGDLYFNLLQYQEGFLKRRAKNIGDISVMRLRENQSTGTISAVSKSDKPVVSQIEKGTPKEVTTSNGLILLQKTEMKRPSLKIKQQSSLIPPKTITRVKMRYAMAFSGLDLYYGQGGMKRLGLQQGLSQKAVQFNANLQSQYIAQSINQRQSRAQSQTIYNPFISPQMPQNITGVHQRQNIVSIPRYNFIPDFDYPTPPPPKKNKYPMFQFGFEIKSSKKTKKSSRRFWMTPSLVGLSLGITTPRKSYKKMFQTGIALRPIPI